MTAPLQLTLTQKKFFTGDAPRTARFAVLHQVTPSTPNADSVAASFILEPTYGVDRERLVRILSLTVPADAGLPVNPLTFFKSTGTDLSAASGVVAGDKLWISSPPGEWDIPSTPVAYVVTDKDTVGQRLEFGSPFPWCGVALTWTLRSSASTSPTAGGTLRASGTDGFTQRLAPAFSVDYPAGPALWRTDRFVAAFDTAAEALAHIGYVQSFIKSLADQAQVDIDAYLDFPPSNPTVTTYP